MNKKFKTQFKLTGWFELLAIHKDGQIFDRKIIKNTITNVGKAEVAALIGSIAGGTAFTKLGIGTGTPSATALGTEVETRATTTNTQVTTTVTDDTCQFVGSITMTATRILTEAGIFNAASSGDMLCSQSFSAVNLASGDSIQITWKVKVA